MNAQRKRAFLVGISNYKTNGYKAWNNIHGAEDIKLLIPELRKKGFTIQSLVNEVATYNGIVNELRNFIVNTRTGYIVYIHFSCHGQPVEDGLKNDKIDEKDHWDEAIVPIDAGHKYELSGYHGNKHLTDDELNGYIANLRKKIGPTGMLYIAIDACHAGTLSRKGMDTVRGTNEGLTRTGKKYNPPIENTKHYYLPKNSKLAPTTLLEACRSRERNTEIMINGKEYGALTYNICQALHRMSTFDKKSKEIFLNYIYTSIKVKGHWPRTQTLVIED